MRRLTGMLPTCSTRRISLVDGTKRVIEEQTKSAADAPRERGDAAAVSLFSLVNQLLIEHELPSY